MAKTSLSELQINRVNELAFDIWNLILAIQPEENEIPEFLKNVNKKAEYGMKNAISLALRAIYISDSQYSDDFEALIFFLAVRYEYYRQQIIAGSTNKSIGKLFAELGSVFLRMQEMETEKLVHSKK